LRQILCYTDSLFDLTREIRVKIGRNITYAIVSAGMIACSLQNVAYSKAISSIPLYCSVSGTKLLAPSASAVDLCKKIAAAMSKDLGQPVTLVANTSLMSKSKGQWMQVDVKFTKPNTATTAFSHRLNKKVKSYPTFSISIMDRAMDEYVINQLVQELRRLMKG
jgi:hypothetical protein